MKKFRLLALLCVSLQLLTSQAAIVVTVDSTRCQTVTGFGGAACFGAMEPNRDVEIIKKLYGADSEIGLNIMRVEISPNLKGDISYADVGWDTPYDWKGSLPAAQEGVKRGALIFGTPWSPPGAFKTNGIAGGGNSEKQGYQRGKLNPEYYDRFFTWLNMFLSYMKQNGVPIYAVSLQNEPDWWVDYSGCLYEPEELHTLVKNWAWKLDREQYGVKLISAEPLGFDERFSDILLNDTATRKHIDIVAGHIYGYPPFTHMIKAANTAHKYGKEVWMTEHSVENGWDASIGAQRNGLPTWHEELIFAEELNECMLAGGTGYIYWYMQAHWSFIGTGEQQHMPGNEKGKLLRRAYVMSHFSKNVTGSTRLAHTSNFKTSTNASFETSAYIKGDSLIVMAIDTTKNAVDINLTLPYPVKSCEQWLSTEEAVCQKTPVDMASSTKQLTLPVPARSLVTYIFQIDRQAMAIADQPQTAPVVETAYDLQGRRVDDSSRGFCIVRFSNGCTKKIFRP